MLSMFLKVSCFYFQLLFMNRTFFLQQVPLSCLPQTFQKRKAMRHHHYCNTICQNKILLQENHLKCFVIMTVTRKNGQFSKYTHNISSKSGILIPSLHFYICILMRRIFVTEYQRIFYNNEQYYTFYESEYNNIFQIRLQKIFLHIQDHSYV